MSKVTKDMSIAEVLKLDMGTANIFLESGMHCIGCPMASAESIADASTTHGINADELVKKLNDYFEAK
jgi:hybrid cluster-associated redox disulfide protein